MDPKPIIALILERCEQERMLDPLATRLVKLLYLADIEYFRRTGKRLTDLKWNFHHFGPYAFELAPYLSDSSVVIGLRAVELFGLAENPFRKDHDAVTAIRDVVHRWGDADLNDLLDYVYFETEPMQAASRGEYLDFQRISTKQRVASISIRLDKKKLALIQAKLKARASQYGSMRQAAVAPDDFFQSISEWDSDRGVALSRGECFIDPRRLSIKKNEG